MPRITLVVCLFRERDLLARLLRESAGLFDDLVVVHDGPEAPAGSAPSMPSGSNGVPPIDYALDPIGDAFAAYLQPKGTPNPGSTRELVAQHGGRFFEGPRCFQQEPHWPFAWSQAQHDWILRLDADEFPSEELKAWLRQFREASEPELGISGYTCIWPLWDGKRTVTSQWPQGRNFLIHRRRVRFFGMAEQVPVEDGKYEQLPLVLCHQPRRKSYGIANIVVRRQGSIWRLVIAQSLLKSPSELPRWRWGDRPWPEFWRKLKASPLTFGFYRLLRGTAGAIRDQWNEERIIMPLMAFASPLQHLFIGLLYRRLKAKSAGR
jgi:hypothetical protein